MSRSINSKYISPLYEVDDLIFFNNISISGLDTYNKYLELLSKDKLIEASELLNSDGTEGYKQIDFVGSWILNLLVNRLKATETYLKSSDRKKPDLVTYSNTQPTDKTVGYSWISNN